MTAVQTLPAKAGGSGWIKRIPWTPPVSPAGRLMMLGVTTATRTTNLPEVPTLDEAGVTGYEMNTWQMFVGPPRLPEPIVMKLNHALTEVMLTPEAQKFFIDLGMQPRTGSPQEAADYIRVEAPRWSKIIKGIGISVD